MNMIKNNKIPQSINYLNQVFSDEICNKCLGKKVLLTLSGGMDSRAILSILLNKKIPFVALTHKASINDMKIAGKISKDFNFPLIVIRTNGQSKETHCEFKKIFENYDVVLYGTLMSGLFDKFEHFDISESQLEKRIKYYIDFIHNNQEKKYPNVFTPAIEEKVLDALKDIPIYYRLFSYPQRCLIKLNKLNLLNYPHTSYNLKKRAVSYCHRFLVWLMNVAGYK